MGSLDGIVRPFQTPVYTPAPVPPAASESKTPDNVKIICGENGGPKTFSGTVSLTITYYYQKRPTEKKAT